MYVEANEALLMVHHVSEITLSKSTEYYEL
jgi:hypothetical protein